jgi:hypothetical protein
MRRTAVVAAVLALFTATACKGKVEYKDSQETTDKVASLEGQIKDKDTYIQKLRDQNAQLQLGGGGSGSAVADDSAYVFEIDGDVLTLKSKPSGGGGGGATLDDKTATAMGNQFLDIVQKSRGAIQKCYELALKKSNALASRTVDLKLSVGFGSSGSFHQVSFSPDLPAGFDACLRGVAGKWKLPPAQASMTFQANVKLTPT